MKTLDQPTLNRWGYFIQYTPNANEGPQAQEVTGDIWNYVYHEYVEINEEPLTRFEDNNHYLFDRLNLFYK